MHRAPSSSTCIAYFIMGLLALALADPTPARAAWLSEVFLGHAGDPDMPDAIEIHGLAEPGELELVIMDATSADRLGDVKQVVRFDATEQTLLISDGPWPSTTWTDVLDDRPEGVLLDLDVLLGEAEQSFDLAGPRRIHLYAGHTRIEPEMDALDPATEVFLRDGAELLDVLTLAPDGEAVTLGDHEPIVDTSAGWVLVRPEGFETRPADAQWLVGSPDAEGYMTATAEGLKATPSQINPHFDHLHVPAPGSLAATLAGLGLLLARPRQS